jgi:hypothetical membrane protein
MAALNSAKSERETLPSKSVDVRRSGFLFAFTGSAFLLLVTFLEIIYPSYSVHTNTISDLFAVGRLTSTIGEPIAFVIAVSWIAAGYYLYRRTEKRWRLVLNMLPGTGLLLAVLSPENVNIVIHSVGAVLAFFSAPIIMLLAFRSITTSFRYFSLFFGIFSLGAALLEFGAYYSSIVQQSLGPGGAERMILYPVIIWLIGYGNYLLAKGERS